jgi:hypothetical protein
MSNKILTNKKENTDKNMKNKNQKIILVSNIGSMSRKYFVYSLNKKAKEGSCKELFNICFDIYFYFVKGLKI